MNQTETQEQANQAGPEGATGTGQPTDRSTTFRPVEGGGETRSGTTLLVEAYALIWIILMAWLLLLWRKQKTLLVRLDELERAIDKAAAKQNKPTAV